MSYESKIGPKVTPDPAREATCNRNCVGGCDNSCVNSCGRTCEVGGGFSRIVPEGKLK